MEQLNLITERQLGIAQRSNADTTAEGLTIWNKASKDLWSCLYINVGTAKKYGYQILLEPPESKRCEFCNRELEPYAHNCVRDSFELIIDKWVGFATCDCRESLIKYENETKESLRLEVEVKEREIKRLKVEKLFNVSNLGQRFKTRTFDTYNVTNKNKFAHDAAKKYAVEFGKYKVKGIGLNINGTYGTGKTHLAAAVANYLINQTVPVIFGTTITLLGKIKDSYEKTVAESETEIIDLYSKVDLLIIDDLGKERCNAWVLEKLYTIINTRYENNLPIIITTNYSLEALNEKLTVDKNSDVAESLTSRLWEMCRGLEMNFNDYRKQN